MVDRTRVSTTRRSVEPTVVFVLGGHGVDRVVAAMRASLCGRPVSRFDASLDIGPHPAERSVVETVDLDRRRVIIGFDDGIVLQTSLRWSGEWHLYREHERWSKPMSMARVVIEVPGRVAVCFGGAAVETYRHPDARRHPLLGGAGPDVRAVRLDVDGLIDRLVLASDHARSVVDLLGDEHMVTGIGNVVRSEVLWSVALDPRTPSVELDDEDWRDVIEATRRFATQAPDRLEVYGRLGQICRRCHGTIGCDEGDDGRLVYWCPNCQTTLENPHPIRVHDERSTDVRFLDEARTARGRVQIFDDLRDYG